MVNFFEEITMKNHEAITIKIYIMSSINLAKNRITHRNEVTLSSRASSKWEAETITL